MLVVIVPLRLESSRIPRKILAQIDGTTVAARVLKRLERCLSGFPDIRLFAAVDAPEVGSHLATEVPGVQTILTSPELKSGTDRVYAAYGHLLAEGLVQATEVEAVVNVQGDMPFLSESALVEFLRDVRERAKSSTGCLVTISESWPKDQSYDDRAAVKVLCDQARRALYFSRHPIPYSRKSREEAQGEADAEFHVGVYAFTGETLRQFAESPATRLEETEGLEQLRALWLGIPIYVLKTEYESTSSFRGIDVPEDLAWARAFATKGK